LDDELPPDEDAPPPDITILQDWQALPLLPPLFPPPLVSGTSVVSGTSGGFWNFWSFRNYNI